MTKERYEELVQAALDNFEHHEFDAYTWPFEKARRAQLDETIDEITFIFNSENKRKL